MLVSSAAARRFQQGFPGLNPGGAAPPHPETGPRGQPGVNLGQPGVDLGSTSGQTGVKLGSTCSAPPRDRSPGSSRAATPFASAMASRCAAYVSGVLRKCGVISLVRSLGPGRHCSPRHRMPLNPPDEGSTCVSTTWQATAMGLVDIDHHVLGCHVSQELKR